MLSTGRNFPGLLLIRLKQQIGNVRMFMPVCERGVAFVFDVSLELIEIQLSRGI
jgi:hypothetical protein